MKVLGLDSATWIASVGVVDGDRVVAERAMPAATSHAVSLLGLIDATLGEAGVAAGALDLIAVSIGPGSFTGLRIGLSTAKGLSLATGVPVVGVPTLEALALAAGQRSGVVCAALDARKGEIYMAAYRRGGMTTETVVQPTVVGVDRFLQHLPLPCTVVGDAIEVYAERLRPALDPRVEVLPFAVAGPSGAVVAQLGQRRLALAGGDDLTALEPVYIRPSEAELKSKPMGHTADPTVALPVSDIVETRSHEQN